MKYSKAIINFILQGGSVILTVLIFHAAAEREEVFEQEDTYKAFLGGAPKPGPTYNPKAPAAG